MGIFKIGLLRFTLRRDLARQQQAWKGPPNHTFGTLSWCDFIKMCITSVPETSYFIAWILQRTWASYFGLLSLFGLRWSSMRLLPNGYPIGGCEVYFTKHVMFAGLFRIVDWVRILSFFHIVRLMSSIWGPYTKIYSVHQSEAAISTSASRINFSRICEVYFTNAH